MRCQFCGKRLPILRKLTDGEFCSPAHRRAFTEQQEQQALSRLLEASLGNSHRKKKILAHPDAEALVVPGAPGVPGRPYQAAATAAVKEPETAGAPPGCDRFFSTPLAPRGILTATAVPAPLSQDGELLLPDGFAKRSHYAASLPHADALGEFGPLSARDPGFVQGEPVWSLAGRPSAPAALRWRSTLSSALGMAEPAGFWFPPVGSRMRPRKSAANAQPLPAGLLPEILTGTRRPERDWAPTEPGLAGPGALPFPPVNLWLGLQSIAAAHLDAALEPRPQNRALRLEELRTPWPPEAGPSELSPIPVLDGGVPWLAVTPVIASEEALPPRFPERLRVESARLTLADAGRTAISGVIAQRGEPCLMTPLRPDAVPGAMTPERPAVKRSVIRSLAFAGGVASPAPAAAEPAHLFSAGIPHWEGTVSVEPMVHRAGTGPRTGLRGAMALQPLALRRNAVQSLAGPPGRSHPAPVRLSPMAPPSGLGPRIEWQRPPETAGLVPLPAFAPVSVAALVTASTDPLPLAGVLRCPLRLQGAAPRRPVRLLPLPFLLAPANAAEVCITGDQPMVYARPVPPRTVLRPDPARTIKRGGAPDALRQFPASLAPPGMRRAWRLAPADLRWVALVIPLVLLIGWYSFSPKKRLSDAPQPQAAAPAPPAPVPAEGLLDGFLGNFKKNISRRAAVELSEDFRSGLAAWEGDANWSDGWSYDQAGFVRPGSLALLKPSLRLEDYSFEFLGKIDRRALTWVYRAKDTRNYHMGRLVVIQGGPLPQVAFVRSIVKNGRETGRHQVVMHEQVRLETLYRVRVDVAGSDFTTSVLGKVVDTYTDGSHPNGGIGFMTNRGEASRVRWVEVSHQYDTLGRFCAWLVPNELTQPASEGPEKEKLQQVQQERKKEKNP